MQRRVILSPLEPGSRTPEEFRAAVRAVMDERDAERKKDEAAEILTPRPPRARLRSVEKRVLLPPVTCSAHRAAIRAAVEKVAAMREGAKAGEKTAPSTPRQKQVSGKNA
jgi:hypothetical protein